MAGLGGLEVEHPAPALTQEGQALERGDEVGARIGGW